MAAQDATRRPRSTRPTPSTWPAWPASAPTRRQRAGPPQPQAPPCSPGRRSTQDHELHPEHQQHQDRRSPSPAPAGLLPADPRLPAAGRLRLPAAQQAQYGQQPGPVRLRLAAAGLRPERRLRPAAGAPAAAARAAGPAAPQPGALDETSLFDTSMIDLDQLRQYEAGPLSQGPGPGGRGRSGLGHRGPSSILALRSRVRPRSLLPGAPMPGSRRLVHAVQKAGSHQRPPRPPRPARVRHTRAGSASWRAASGSPARSRPPGTSAIEVIGVPEGATIELDLRLESVMDGVLVTGTARAP